MAAILLYFRLISVRIRAQMQDRLPFLFELLTAGFSSLISFLILALLLQRFKTIAGWSITDLAFLYGTVDVSFGLMDMVFSGFDPPNFGAHVRLGSLDQMFLRPVSLTLQVFGSEFTLRRIGRILQGGFVLAYALSAGDIVWTAGKVIYLPLVILSLVLFFGGLFIIGATITFWTVESIEAINIFTYGGTEMMTYPMNIYQDWLRRFFTYFLPAIFLNYYPALYFLGKPDPFGMPGFAPFLSPLAGVGVFAAALLFWNYGLRAYQSTGT